MLEVKHLTVAIDGKEVLKDFNLSVKDNEIAVVMGPNAAGKSTLAQVIAGNPRYKVISGEILWNGNNLLNLRPEQRAAEGIFVAFQNPIEVPGVNLQSFLWKICNLRGEQLKDFIVRFSTAVKELGLNQSFTKKELNVGSGGEKKRMEILQMLMLQPKFAVFDEIDSGVDVDSLKIIGAAIEKMRKNGLAGLIITHHGKILDYVRPDSAHIVLDGQVAKTGQFDLVQEIETRGYEWIKQ